MRPHSPRAFSAAALAAILPCVALAATLALPAAAATERPEDRWNLADLYPDTAAWNADAKAVEATLAQITACKGHLGDSARRLKECLDLWADAGKRGARLGVYAYELTAQDTGIPSSLELRQRAQVLGSKVSEATSFVRPELLALGKPAVDRLFAEEPGLAIYRHPVDDILRSAPHTR
ncbi:MAG TPA: hypothetical protein VFO24_05845, partial [Usitatibacter sp.]|nr:hypothetical protein [Usitatibacter sp.]